MTYEKAYIVINGKKYLDGIYNTEKNSFQPYEEFVEDMIHENKSLNSKLDELKKYLEMVMKEEEEIAQEFETLKKECGKRSSSCRGTKEKMKKIIVDRLGLFAMNNGTAFLDGPTCQMIMDSVINDMKKEDLWIDD